MNYMEMKEGFKEASDTMRAADVMATDFAKMLLGRLRRVHVEKESWVEDTLSLLKKELCDYNAQERKWKKQ